METNILNNNRNEKKNGNKMGYVAGAAAAAGLGAAGAAAAANLIDDDDPGKEPKEQDEDSPTTSQTGSGTSATNTASQQGNTGSSSSAPHTDNTQNTVDETPGTQDQNDETHDDEPPININGGGNEPLHPVNPQEIAEAIISEEMVDPKDIDQANVLSFEEVGTIYTVTGESYDAATFHDMNGNHLAMVDVDGDGVMDIVTDLDGNEIEEASYAYLGQNDITKDDIEYALMENQTTDEGDPGIGYMAATDVDPGDDMFNGFDDPSIMDDIITA